MQKQTDNDAEMFEIKIELRERLIQDKQEYKILEAFSGDGLLWATIQHRNPDKKLTILRIDQKEGKRGVYLKGDNVKYISSMDLTSFDLIDLDAYGSPFPQLDIIFKSKYAGPIVCTFIQSMAGALHKGFLNALGYTPEMIKKCPSIFNISGLDKMKAFLALNRVTSLTYYSHNRKNYFSFFTKKD